MHVTSLILDNVRIVKHCEIELAKGVTAFIGDNGQGKTTLLEALYWASHHKSFRHVTNNDVIAKDSDQSHINVRLTDDVRPQDIDITLHRVGRDNVVVNGQKLKRNRDLFGTLKVSIFTPDDLDIVKGSSALRREIFDDTLSQISPKYVAAFSDYSRILKQKNALLKTMDFDRELLNVLNQSLVSSGSQLIRGRLKALTTMREVLSQSYSHIADENDVIDARYISKIFGNDHEEDVDVDESMPLSDIAAAFSAKIEEYSSVEQRRCHSVVGPHRDDISLLISSRESRTQASQGEQRSMALALKMAAHQVVYTQTGDNPVLLLDDVFSELDLGRAHRLIECLPATQTFVTTATEIPSTLKVNETFNVHQGTVKKS
jgi:DNA replication and repair protein RecF